jgi:uncharacterized UPF0160 family protein
MALWVTHSGKFHCDEVFGYAVLRLALGDEHELRRTRKPDVIAAADIVWDVGGIYDADAKRFDHHQKGAPLRDDGAPFSAAGLLWRHYGPEAVRRVLPAGDAHLAAVIAAEIEQRMVRRIDEIDTGVSLNGPVKVGPLELASLIGDFNPTWDSPESVGPAAGDDAFIQAAALAQGVLRRRIESARSKFAAEALVLQAYAAGEDQRVLVLPRGMPWKNVVFAKDLPVLFAVSPASNGNWMLDTVPPEPQSFAQRLPLPAAWAGLEGAALAQVCGVEDAVFVHLRRFVGAARSRAGALAMARAALAADGLVESAL